MTGEGPKSLSPGRWRGCRRQGPMPAGVTTVERMVATGREAADQRLWQQLTSPLTPQTSSALLRLLTCPTRADSGSTNWTACGRACSARRRRAWVARADRVAGPGRGGRRVAGRVDGPAAPVARAGDARHCGQDDLLRNVAGAPLGVLVATVLACRRGRPTTLWSCSTW